VSAITKIAVNNSYEEAFGPSLFIVSGLGSHSHEGQ
jgi:hypothetical protein